MTIDEKRHFIGLLRRANSDDLDWVQKEVAEAKKQISTKRKKELWGNVRAAIKKYIAETGNNIVLYERDGGPQDYVLVDSDLDDFGIMYFD